MIQALDRELSPATFVPHELHRPDREWTETNCYADLWIEVIATLGHNPTAAAVCTLSTDFEGDQWTMFKFPTGDLWRLFGIEVAELNVWRPLREHIAEQLSFGRLLSVDVDGWHLPDTETVAYRTNHQKTTVAVQMIDLEQHRLGYFHNAGYFELDGEDFDGLLGSDTDDSARLPPYVEMVKLDRLRSSAEPALESVKQLVAEHLERRPKENPILKFHRRIEADLPWLASQDSATFHRYAFGTCRQCGASAQLAVAFLDWLETREQSGLAEVAAAFRTISEGAKWLQFMLARAQRGKAVHLEEKVKEMADAWDFAMAELVGRYGH